MRILRHAGEAREFARRDELLQVLPEGLPALREGFLGGSAEEGVGEVARAERREERETVLLFRRGVPRLLFDLKHQSDGGDVVGGARLPVGREAASARETEIVAREQRPAQGRLLRSRRSRRRSARRRRGRNRGPSRTSGRSCRRAAGSAGRESSSLCWGPFGRARSTGGRGKAPPGSGSWGLKGGAGAARRAGASRG